MHSSEEQGEAAQNNINGGNAAGLECDMASVLDNSGMNQAFARVEVEA
jgi:hypothetical protein